MVENEQDNEKRVLEDFELTSELSTLVEKNIIPIKIAKRLEFRLKEKNVKITKMQLNQLAEKIRYIMREFIKDLPENQKETIPGKSESQETDENVKKMLETIEKLQGKIGEIESKKTSKTETQSSEKTGTQKEFEYETPSPEINPPTATEQKEEENKNQGVTKLTHPIAPQPAEEVSKEMISSEVEQPLLVQQPNERKSYTASPRFVTTENIKLPNQPRQIVKEWNLDPLLEIPGDTESIIILMKWLQNLIDKCGHQNLSNILDYYVDIGWISDDVKITLIDYSQGITGDNNLEIPTKDVSNLPSKDHIESLIFIQKLKGIQFDKHFIDRIEGEISKITKKISNYSSK